MIFDKKLLVIGYGAVSQCTLPLLPNYIDFNSKNLTIIDFEDKSKSLKPYTDRGAKFKQIKIVPGNLESVLSNHVGKNGLVIDLAWNIGANDIIDWCHKNNTLYLNTSVELWDPDAPKTIFDKTLYKRQMSLRQMTKDWSADSTTAIVDHGANPGLISHFTKKALIDISEKAIYDKIMSINDLEKLTHYKNTLDFPHLAQKLGVKVIHCSERDTQITNRPKEVDEFVNTWSIEGLREEGTAPSELGWGTHEKELPALAHLPPYGPMNQIFLAQMGINTEVRSWVPEVGEIIGRVIRHGEAFSISDRLSVRDGNGKRVYGPTVHYAYMLCHEALSSLVELKARGYKMQPKLRIMNDEITSGKDILGALVMGHAYDSWWTGSSLSIEETRRLVPGQNATTLQVAAGILSAAKWAIENPKKGFCIPDDLPHDYILKEARPYLGDLISIPSNWTPLKTKENFFPENKNNVYDLDPWQFKNFVSFP